LPYNENNWGAFSLYSVRQQQEEMKSLIQNSLTLGESIKLQKQANQFLPKKANYLKKASKHIIVLRRPSRSHTFILPYFFLLVNEKFFKFCFFYIN